jgi:glyoxylase-like metal-dependent hydrolase (beta-lactamase superfamily II)
MRIASGLHRVGSQIVNSYLIAGHDGVTIIDAGCRETAPGRTSGDGQEPRRRAGAHPHARGYRPHWLRCPAAPRDGWAIADGDVLDVPGSPRIIHTPGHTPGSVAVHVPALDALFLGDTMTTRNVLTGVTGPKPAPFTLEPEQAVASLGRVEGVDATWLLPGHGPAWDGGDPGAIRLIRETSGPR